MASEPGRGWRLQEWVGLFSRCGGLWECIGVFLRKGGHRGWVGVSQSQGGCGGVHEALCPADSNKWGLVLERLVVLGRTFSDKVTRGEVFVRRLLELHILKMVALYTVWVALEEVPLGVRGWGAQPSPLRC